MSAHLYLVDFPSKKEKFWQSYIKNAQVSILKSSELKNQKDYNSQGVYFFYIDTMDSFSKIESTFNLNNGVAFNYAILLSSNSILSEFTPKVLRNTEKLVLLSVDDPQFNLGNISTLNYVFKLHDRDANLSVKFKNKIQELSTQFDVAIERLEKQLMLARQKFFAKDFAKPIKFNAVQFDYTYRAGNKPGTEYSDFIFWGEWALWLNFSSTSYAEASVLLKFVEDCRKEKDYWNDSKLNDILKLYHKTLSDFENVMNSKVSADYFICLVNAKNKTADYVVKGAYECIDDKGKLWPLDTEGKKTFHKVFAPGEKFVMLTPGLFRNIMNESKKTSLRNFVKENLNKLRQEILTELVMILEQDHSNFLDYDMNVVYGEIAKDGSK